MEKLEELLPGIEEFLCQDLARETLSEESENKRLYYLERIDIIKLPPSIPPLFAVPEFVPPAPVATTPIVSPTRSENFDFEDNDFAAHQREISRSFIKQDDSDTEEKEVKVYDDIDQGNLTQRKDTGDDSKNSDDTDFYEIPVLKTTPTSPTHSGVNGYQETNSAIQDGAQTLDFSIDENDSKPPPLPPRRDRTASDAISRSSCGSILDEKPPILPHRPHLPTKSEIYNMTEKTDGKSEKSDHTGDFTDDQELTSYESCDEEDKEIQNKLDIKLPKPLKKNKKQKRSSKSRSSKEWDVTKPFSGLEEVTLTGELNYKGKLSWTKKVVALTEGRLVCYKPEKVDSKPALVIHLTGYEAISQKLDKKGFDIRLIHPSLEMHMFSADFKEWAQLWCDYINAMSQGKPPPGQYSHLARSTTFAGVDSSHIYGSKPDLRRSSSNNSTTSSQDNLNDYSTFSLKRKSRKDSTRNKVNRMGSIAYRATQFFESIGKKSGKKVSQSISTSASLGNLQESDSDFYRPSSIPSPLSDLDVPVFADPKPHNEVIPEVDYSIQHQGNLCIYSSFNKRKWGTRWCVVRENNFECYKNQSSKICELDFKLRNCVLRRAVGETKSELGLMLTENDTEKITVEPLNLDGMNEWLRVFMNETITESLPDGLQQYLIHEESPYHDIKLEDMSSPILSDGFGYNIVHDVTPKTKVESPYDLGDDDIFEDDTTNSTFVNQSEAEQSLTEGANKTLDSVSSEKDITSDSHVPGEVTGDLYTQVQRKSSSGSMQIFSRENSHSEDGEMFSSTVIKRSAELNNGRTVIQTHEISKSTQNRNEITSSTFTESFSAKFSGYGEEGSLFSEILTKINDQFGRDDMCREEEKNIDEDANTDTAYNSAICSENSSLERKNRSDPDLLTHSSKDVDNLSSSTVFQVSPIEDHVINNDLQNSNIEESNNNFNNQSILWTNNHLINSNDSNPIDDQSRLNLTTQRANTISVVDSNSKCDSKIISSRDQCDSAIFESDSILDDLSNQSSSIVHKIEQLRTHLVELKKKRICVRDQKLQTTVNAEKLALEDEYDLLDEECKSVSDAITVLEQQIVVS